MHLVPRIFGWSLVPCLLLGCVFSGSDDDATVPEPAPPTEGPKDPGCTRQLQHEGLDGGRASTESYGAVEATDAGASEPADAGGDAAAAPDAGGAPPPLTADLVRQIACRDGTGFDVAAAAEGGLTVAAAGYHGQVIGFGSAEPTVRTVDALRATGAVARVATLTDGRTLVVGTGDGADLISAVELEPAQHTQLPGGAATLGRPTRTQTGTVVLQIGADQLFVQKPAAPSALVPLFAGAQPPGVSLVGYTGDERAFRVGSSSPPVLELEHLTVPIDPADGTPALGGAFAPLGDARFPALALVRGSLDRQGDTAGQWFEVALPRGEAAYAHVPLLPPEPRCLPDASCSNECDEIAMHVEPRDVAMTADASHTFLVFVRTEIARHRRYQVGQNSGILCDVFGCDPYCGAQVTSTTTRSAELVIATLDAVRGRVDERFVLPLEVVNGGLAVAWPELVSSDEVPIFANAKDGYLHVSRSGRTAAGSYSGITTIRFHVGG